MPVFRYARITALSLTLLAAAPVFGAESPDATLDALFQTSHASGLAEQVVNMQLASISQTWQQESDPTRKARIRAMYDEAERIVRNRLAWSNLSSLAREAYREQLSEAEIAALLTYFRSPTGQLYVTTVVPASVKANASAQLYFTRRMEAIRQRLSRNLNPEPVQVPAPAAGSNEALAMRYIQADGSLQAAFSAQMLTLEETLLNNIAPALARVPLAQRDQAQAEIKRLVAAFRAQIQFAEIATIHAKALAEALDAQSLQQLVDDAENPAQHALLDKNHQAEHLLRTRIDQYLHREVMPEILRAVQSVAVHTP